jgi:CRP/FNR family cyclic AMP-dependent transcriptional regulator
MVAHAMLASGEWHAVGIPTPSAETERERRPGSRQSSETDDKTKRSFPALPAVSLTAAFPEIAEAIPPEDRDHAEHTLIAPVLAGRDEDLIDLFAAMGPDVFDLLIIDGVVIKETILAGRSASELLGPGDFLAPPLSTLRQAESRALSHYLAHGPVSLAAIDGRFRQAARHWPGLFDVLHDRLGQQTHRASMHLAMLHLARTEDRIRLLFADLAERFGRVTADGIVIDLSLTHETIGRLVGSRRPSVSIALHALSSEGSLMRADHDRWKLAATGMTQ